MTSHLSSEQINEIRADLKQRFVTLQQEVHDHLLASGDDKYTEIAGQVHDRGEESVAEFLADLNYTVIDNHVKEIQAIEKTLYNIQTGSYGLCSDCGVNIPFERLKATPIASRCVKCQQAYEDKFLRGAL